MKRKSCLYKRIASVLLASGILFAGVTNAYASKLEDAQDKRDEAQAKLDEVNREIEAINEAQSALQAEMDAYDEALMALLTDLTLLEEDIAYKQEEIHQAEADLKAAEIREAEQYAAMKLRIQYMYENSDSSVWMALVGASSITEALNRTEYISNVYEYDRDQLTEYQETVQEVKDLKARLDIEMIEMEELQMNMEEQQNELEILIAESSAVMADFNTQLANASSLAREYAKTIKKQNQIITEEEERIAREKAEAEAAAAAANAGNASEGSTTSESGSTSESNNSSSGSSGGLTGDTNPSYTTSVSGQDVVNYASQFVGNPYVFGGTSLTEGCDCSYFVQACFGNFGIKLPRTSYQQRSSGQAVSYANAQAGDIICYAGHVAIYMGSGKIVHAANARQGICYGEATYRTIVAVRRVL